MPEIEAFEPVTVVQAPSVAAYQGATYRSDREYVDTAGSIWSYFGLYDGSSMWRRGDEDTVWNITAIVDQFGPLTQAEAPHA
ncbi:phiSA1p31-related protein [Streptomyces canus]|uniref:phiSA1p31-related protein n=1 Tax=Streptomyces canus TaxID=58343 RepID=UPI0033FF4EE6